MRPARMIGGVALLLALGIGVRAEPEPKKAVTATAVEVRSGPSPKFYPTSKLNPGEEVILADETKIPWLAAKKVPAGWVAILPPRNSFSWVNKRFLTITSTNPPSAMIRGDAPVSVRVGSGLYDGAPDVEQVKMKPGDIAVVVGLEKTDADGIWVPLLPPPQEVRYVPAEALKPAAPFQTVSTAPPPAATAFSASTAPQSTGATPAPAAVAEDPLWVQAEKAQREGKRDDAERFYLQLANQTRDHDLCIRCWNRIYFLRQAGVASATVATTPAASYYPKAADTRIMPIPGYPSQAPPTTVPAIRPTSQYTYTPEIPIPTANQHPQANYAPPPAAAPAFQSRGPGILRKSSQPVQGQDAYMLDMGRNHPVLYVTAQPGLSLEPYRDRNVILSGPIYYHQGYRKEHLVAAQVTPAPN